MADPVAIVPAASKKPWQSKTIIFSAIVSIAGVLSSFGLFPQVSQFLQGHADTVLGILGAAGIGLRLITNGKISID